MVIMFPFQRTCERITDLKEVLVLLFFLIAVGLRLCSADASRVRHRASPNSVTEVQGGALCVHRGQLADGLQLHSSGAVGRPRE